MAKKNFASSEARQAIIELKDEIAKELGVYETVKKEGWGGVSSRNCGNIVKKVLEKQEKKDG